MAAVEVGVQQVKHFNTDALILFLSKHGISQTGLKALRDNQVEGDMLLEFTDADLKDIFDVFKDRFLIRKMLRGLYGPNNTPCRMGRTIAPSVPTTHVVTTTHIPTATTLSSSSSSSSSTPITVSMLPKINSQTAINRQIQSDLKNALESYVKAAPPQHNLQKETYLNTPVTSVDNLSSRVKIPVRIFPSGMSNHEKITSRLIAAGASRSTSSVQTNNANNISVYSTPKTFETHTTPVQQTQSNIKPHVIDDDDDDDDDDITDNDFHVIDGWGASRIKDFSAEELLRRKMRRGRPTEAQRLGRSLLREAATTANIWNTAPPLKMITADKKEAFFRFICRAAPQLSRHKQFVWIRLGEALQNRRKYLSDKECGRRTTKRRRDSENSMMMPHPLLPLSGLIQSCNIVTTTTNTNPYSMAPSLSLSTLSSPSVPPHSTPSSSSVKNEVEPIIIEADSLTILQDPSSQSASTSSVMRTGSPIETINLTTLIKEEVESEQMKCWTET